MTTSMTTSTSMKIIIVKELKVIHGSKYAVLLNNEVLLLEDINHRLDYEENEGIVLNVDIIYILDDFYSKLINISISLIDINNVISIDGQYRPTENGIPFNKIWVKIHWKDYNNKINENYTIEDFNCLGYRDKKPSKNSSGKKRLSLDSNTFMRKAIVNLFNLNNINFKKQSVIYGRTSIGKNTKDENSIDSQFKCGFYISRKNNLSVVDMLLHNGKTGGSHTMKTRNTSCPLFIQFINSEYDTLIVKFINRLCRKVSKFIELFLLLKSQNKNIITLISNPIKDYCHDINTYNDYFLNNITTKEIDVLMDRSNFIKNPAPDGMYMSLIYKSSFLEEMHEAELVWVKISAGSQRNADLKKKRKLEDYVSMENINAENISALRCIISKSKDEETINKALLRLEVLHSWVEPEVENL